MPFILAAVLWLGCVTSAIASPVSLTDIYINPEGKHLSEAVILYNSQNPCENCNKTIDMIINVLRTNYHHKLRAYMVDISKEPQFASAFHTDAPLTFVIIRISDGAAFGYEKLTGLQSQIADSQAFNRHIIKFINNFLGF